MVLGHFVYEPQCSVEDALGRGAALPELLSTEAPVWLYAASLCGDAWTLGHYQNPAQVLCTGDARAGRPALDKPWFRRASGGMTTRAGDGIVYVALALLDRSTLMPCPLGRLLNRNVRGVLAGLRKLGLPINYFGRDFLSCGTQPAVYVGWDARATGEILLEYFIAHTSPWFVPDTALAYPKRAEPALRGRAPITLSEAQPRLAGPEGQADLVRAICDGHTQAFGVHWSSAAAPQLPAPSPSAERTQAASDRLVWSALREEAIGFVGAGVRLDADGRFAEVHLTGDFFAHRACKTTLDQLLLGTHPSKQGVSEAVDATFTRSGYDVEGIRNLSVFRDAILDAAEQYANLSGATCQ